LTFRPRRTLYSEPMRDRIRERLTEYRNEALERIASAENRTKSTHSGRGTSTSSMCDRDISEDNKAGFADYMDQSADFIRQLAPGSGAQYADELRNGANTLKQNIMARTNNRNVRGQLDPALDKIIKRKVEDFEWNIEGREMNATTNNTVNIIGSNITNSVMQITQSGKDTISKDTAQKLEQLVNSDEIKALPEEERFNVLDQVDVVVKELKAPTTDKGKVHRGLKRLGNFISSVGSKAAADVVAQAAIAYAKANGMIP
jgi:hypothetical protein